MPAKTFYGLNPRGAVTSPDLPNLDFCKNKKALLHRQGWKESWPTGLGYKNLFRTEQKVLGISLLIKILRKQTANIPLDQSELTAGTQTDRLHSKYLTQQGGTLALHLRVDNCALPHRVEVASAADLPATLIC